VHSQYSHLIQTVQLPWYSAALHNLLRFRSAMCNYMCRRKLCATRIMHSSSLVEAIFDNIKTNYWVVMFRTAQFLQFCGYLNKTLHRYVYINTQVWKILCDSCMHFFLEKLAKFLRGLLFSTPCRALLASASELTACDGNIMGSGDILDLISLKLRQVTGHGLC